MKTIKYLLMVAIAVCVASCQGDWDEPTGTTSIGNPNIQETNVITLATLKAKYASAVDKNGYMLEEIKEDLQLKVIVTGNDVGGNFYKQICVQDETGGIIIGINQGGLSGILAEGQQILINLKGLYYGAYGSQPQIGMPYTNDSGGLQIGQINMYLWNQHFKLLEMQTPIQPVDFKDSKNIYCITQNTFLNLEYKGGETRYVYYVTALDRLQNESKPVKKKVSL